MRVAITSVVAGALVAGALAGPALAASDTADQALSMRKSGGGSTEYLTMRKAGGDNGIIAI